MLQNYVTFAEKESYKSSLKVKIIDKVKDHCHYTGKYRGTAHNICNLKFNVPNEIPVAIRNDSNYDYHFVIKELANRI